jgi:outer membrane protein, multidrug efflux system
VRRLAAIAAVVMTSACSLVNPVHVTPPAAPPAFSTGPGAAEASGDPAEPSAHGPVRSSSGAAEATPASASAEPAARRPAWWSAFADPVLDTAIQEGFRNSRFIRDVRGLIYENMLDPAMPQGWWWPLQVGILAPAGVRHVAANLPPPPAGGTQLNYNVANASLGATYQIDVWGNLDAQRRAGMNVAEQQRQLTEGHVQDLAARIAQAWFDILESRALRELTLTQIKYNEELFELVKARFEQHLASRLVVLQQEQLLLNLRAQVPLIDARIALANSQLHQLVGRMPSPADDIVPLDRQLPDVPPAPGVGTPSDLNANTPEMRLAGLRVAEIKHRINANLSSWLPQINLVGSVGATTYGVSQPILRDESFGVTLTWIMFDGRRITESRRLPIQLRRREAQYELALQTAVGRVQDAVIRENTQATSLKSLRARVELGRQLLAEARRLFEQGQSDYLAVLAALNNQVDLERAALQAQRLVLNNRVELYRAIGGTWSNDVTKLRE